MVNVQTMNNENILNGLSVLAKKTVDYYLDRDNGNILSSIRSKEDMTELSITVDNFLANAIIEKYKLN